MKQNKVTAKQSHKCQWAVHATNIAHKEFDLLVAWHGAAMECREHYKGNALAYAREAVKVMDTHTQNTIRLYVGALLKAISKWGETPKDIRRGMEHVVGYAYASMDDVRKYFNPNQNNKEQSEPAKRKEKTVPVTSRKVYSACKKLGIPKGKADQLIGMLNLK